MTAKQALVTGGARGIGRAIAEALRHSGYHVIVTGLGENEVHAVPVAQDLAAIQLDVTDEAAIARAFSSINRLDVLINCAGIIMRGSEYDPAVFRNVVEVNLTGTMLMCLAARPLLAASGAGAIVNTASMLSTFGGALVPAYAASKGGIVQLTKSLAIAWAAEGIRVNAVAPGWIMTDLTRDIATDEVRSAAILSRTPMKRWGTPEDISGSVVHLCSDAARFVTGTVVTIDGGYAAM